MRKEKAQILFVSKKLVKLDKNKEVEFLLLKELILC